MRFSLVLLSLFSLASQAADQPSIHNMIVFGSEKIYVSHLPMYEHNVHRYQAIYEVTFGDEGDRKYREEKGANVFGISPQEPFTMPGLKKESEFPAGLHSGHPETVPAKRNVQVKVLRLVHFHPLKREGGERPKNLTYFKAGSGRNGEVYLAHLLTTPTKGLDTAPDQFDQIVRIKRAFEPATLEEVKIPEGSLITVDTADTYLRRLTPTPDSKNFTRAKIVTATGSVEVLLHVAAEEYIHTGGDVRIDD